MLKLNVHRFLRYQPVYGDPLSPLMFIMCAEGAMRAVDAQAQCPSLSSLPARIRGPFVAANVHHVCRRGHEGGRCSSSMYITFFATSSYTQYADDTTLHDSNHQSVKSTVDDCEAVFLKENPNLNVNKTEYFSAAKDDGSWRSVKLLESRLGTAEDLNARMSAANSAFSTISWKRHSLQSRLTMFQCLIIPILLYNCSLWTLTKALSDKLDIWHRKKLKFLHNIRHPHHISNFALYKLNSSRSLSSICKERRLLWFGHAARQSPSSPTHQALLLAIDVSDVRRPRGRPPLCWIDTVRQSIRLQTLYCNVLLFSFIHLYLRIPQRLIHCIGPSRGSPMHVYKYDCMYLCSVIDAERRERQKQKT